MAGLNQTPTSERIQIGFFGKRNSGKSSLINAVTSQNLSIVSDTKGTTTDPVSKSMELLPLGPVTLIDTAGFDDEGDLGELRRKKTFEVLNKVDIAVFVAEANKELTKEELDFISKIKEKGIKYITVFNKSDLVTEEKKEKDNEIYVSAKTNIKINELKEKIAGIKNIKDNDKFLVQDLIEEGNIVILVIPTDSSAPKGRLILPQQQVIRDLLEKNAIIVSVGVKELKSALEMLKEKPSLVITDSQAFKEVNEILPYDIKLTSFSMLFARYKGVFDQAIQGCSKLKEMNDGNYILISEGCTHHRQCEDIGSVKLPKMIKKYTKKELNFEFTSGCEFPQNLSKYKLIIHCGGCMLPERAVKERYDKAKQAGIPISNYGIIIAEINGILRRSSEIFKKI